MGILTYRTFMDAPVIVEITKVIVFSAFVMLFTSPAEGYYTNYSKDNAACTSKSIALRTCFNKYHESDYYSLIGIIFASNYTDECSLTSPRPNLTMEAPELQDNLDKIQGIYSCLRKEVDNCDQMNAFFDLRHLLFTFQKALLWLNCPQSSVDTEWADEFHFTENVADEPTTERNSEWTDASFRNKRFFCSKEDNRMDRFADILKAFNCFECFRLRHPVCNLPEGKFINEQHLLRNIIRLQVFPSEVCPEVKLLMDCLETNAAKTRCASAHSMELYKLLFFTWCGNTYSTDLNSGGLTANSKSVYTFGAFCIWYSFRLVLFQ